MIYKGVSAVSEIGHIRPHWFDSEIVPVYKKRDPDCPENYRLIAITNSIYCVIMKIYRGRVQ